jgi:hypothetical protein
VGHERIFDGTFRSLAVKQHAYMVAGDVKIVHEPAFHFERVIDTGRQVPNFAGFVLVDTNNEGKNGCRHRPEGCSVREILTFRMSDVLWDW